ncbi:MAG: serine hydrolase domain-containing protein [Dehalococcoidia bacterium]
MTNQLAPSAVEIHGSYEPRFAAVAEAFAQNFESHGDVGASVAVTVNGETVVDLWAGTADPELGVPWRQDTIVNVWSSTKGPAALCVHILADRGLLDLDAPVAAYWPEFAQAGKAGVLVRWLLSHQAGLPAVDGHLPPGATLDWDYMVSRLEEQAPLWEPGTKRGYHAITYGWLLGELVRRVSGKRLGEFFRDEVAIPYGIDFTIGLPASEDYRTAKFIYPYGVGGVTPIDLHPAMYDPNSISYRAIAGILNAPVGVDVNSREWRAGEFPAAGGHGNGRSLAQFYAILACGGELNGRRLISCEAIERASTVEVVGTDEFVMLSPAIAHQALGFNLAQLSTPNDPRPATAFGGGGAGGSLCFADPENRLSFGYAMNQAWRMRLDDPDPRGASLVRAAYKCI